jgi:hypothetical protein
MWRHVWIFISRSTSPNMRPPYWTCAKCGTRVKGRTPEDDGCTEEK